MAQKHGFSGGKAVAGILLTGGIGVLAGLHGSSDIDVHCIACGHKWNPARRVVEERQTVADKKANQERRWRHNFYRAVEKGDYVRATRLLPRLNIEGEIDDVYAELKSQDRKRRIILTVQILLILLFSVWFLYKCG